MMKSSQKRTFFLALILFGLFSFKPAQSKSNISGELAPWHKVILTFERPNSSETSIPNPFTDYKFDVTFTSPAGKKYLLPGFYNTDGKAGETGTFLIPKSTNTNIGTPPEEIDQDWVGLIIKTDETKPLLGISNPVINKTIEEGDIDTVIDTIKINIVGCGMLDSLKFQLQNESWLTVSNVSIINGEQQFYVTLNDKAKELPIGEHISIITFLSDSAEAVFVNYKLSVKYNLHGQNYFYGDNNIVIMEMESNELKTDWLEATEHEGFSGDGYYYYNGDFNPAPLDTNIYEYFFYIPSSGTYKVAIRNYIPNNDFTESNDSWLKMDDDRWWKHFSHTNLEWNWETQLDDGHENFYKPVWDLESGVHVLKIGGRSTNFCLDKIHIYKTNTKEQFALDPDLIESPTSDRNQAIISTNTAQYIFNFTHGSIPAISAKTINITNVGTGVLDSITAKVDNNLISASLNGEGNEQTLTIEFNDQIKKLEPGTHTSSVTLECQNATKREIKLYFNIKEDI